MQSLASRLLESVFTARQIAAGRVGAPKARGEVVVKGAKFDSRAEGPLCKGARHSNAPKLILCDRPVKGAAPGAKCALGLADGAS